MPWLGSISSSAVSAPAETTLVRGKVTRTVTVTAGTTVETIPVVTEGQIRAPSLRWRLERL